MIKPLVIISHPFPPPLTFLETIITREWYLIQQQPLLKPNFQRAAHDFIQKRGCSPEFMLLRVKLYQRRENQTTYSDVV